MDANEGELSDHLLAHVQKLCAEGDRMAEAGDYESAVLRYESALNLLPEPIERWEAATWILTALGDVFFLAKNYVNALNALLSVMHCPNAIGNPFVHLRLGQAQFELGNEILAKDELARAYMGGGAEIFNGEDKKYFDLVKRTLQPPLNGW